MVERHATSLTSLGPNPPIARLRLKTLGSWLLVAALVLPTVSIPGGGVSIRIETVAMPVLLLLTMLFGRVGVPRFAWVLLTFWLWNLSVTIFHSLSGADGEISSSVVLGNVRPILTAVTFYSIRFTPGDYIRLLNRFVFTAFPIGILAIAQAVNFPAATSFTLQLYGSAVRDSLVNQVKAAGWLSRASGTFEAPSYAATYFLLAIGTALWLFARNPPAVNQRHRLLLITSAVVALLGGSLTLSSTFIAGLVVLGLSLLMVLPWKARVKAFAVACVAALLTIPPFLWAASRSPIALGSIRYQLERLGSLEVFLTRFGTTGQLLPTLAPIANSPLAGWGFLILPGVFLGDSAYIVWLYLGGAVGLALMILVLGLCLTNGLRLGSLGTITVLWLIVLLAAAFGSPSFAIPRLGDWWWALAAIAAAGNKRWSRT